MQKQKGWLIWMNDMEVLVDTNIILDWMLEREPFMQNAKRIIELCILGKIKGHLTSHTLLNVFYIARKRWSVEERKEILLMLCEKFNIIGVNRSLIVASLQNNDWDDLEDGLQMQSASAENLGYIITRDLKDFKASKVQALSPKEFLEKI